MRPEVLVFAHDERVHKLLGKVLYGDDFALFLGKELRYEASLDIQKPGGKGGIEIGEILHVGYVPCGGDSDADADAQYESGCQGDDQGGF